MIPRLVIAAPASGAGKTTVATGLMAALRARGLAVSPHKVGPDYIDPGYHALATGRPGRNLDPFLVGAERIVPLFLHGAAGADVAVVEGVLGLYDGRGATDFASTAHVARLLSAPVVLVVDAAGQARSAAALVHGFASYDERVRLGGVVLNRVASDRHEDLLRAALAGIGVPVLGALRRDGAVSVPSRHLGLVPAVERSAAAVAGIDRLAALVARSCDLGALLALARSAPPLDSAVWEPPGVVSGARAIVAVAGGAAFSFGYQEHVEALTAAGAEVVSLDPLRDESLPAGTDALVFGGGFPEVYADQLCANTPLRAAVAAFAGPIDAECAGLLYLGRELEGRAMCGVLPARARMTGQLVLGYREAVDRSGESVRAHEFHRTALSPEHGAVPAYTIGTRQEGFAQGHVHASYLHRHWAGCPEIAPRLVAAARRAAP